MYVYAICKNNITFFFVVRDLIAGQYFHGENVRYYCPNNCGRNYNAKRSVMRHLRNECGVSKKFSCPFCPKKFSYNNDMCLHAAIVHKTVLPRMRGEHWTSTPELF